MTPRRYMGLHIWSCDYAEGVHDGKWYVETHHPQTGYLYECGDCRHFNSIEDAKAAIRFERYNAEANIRIGKSSLESR